MATYRRLPSGKWQATVRLRDGRRITQTAALKVTVKIWAEEQERLIRSGAWIDPRTARTVGQWLDLWQPSRVVEDSTARRDKYSEVRVRAAFGDTPLIDVTRLAVQTWIKQMTTSGVGAASVEQAYKFLTTALNAAITEGLLMASPCRKIALPRNPVGLPPWFTHEQVDAIVDELREPYATMTLVMCWLGLRWGECAGLRVQDVDWLRRRVRVVGALPQRGGTWKEYPKTNKSRRELPAPEFLIERMSAVTAPEGLVFVTRYARTPHDSSAWRREWYPALVRAGAPRYSPHACRHTCASWLVQDGVPLYDVQVFLGHSDSKMTQRYAHLQPGAHGRVEASWAKMPHIRRTDGKKGL